MLSTSLTRIHPKRTAETQGWDAENKQETKRISRNWTYLLHIGLGHVNVGVHLVKIMLGTIGFFAVSLKPTFALQETSSRVPY